MKKIDDYKKIVFFGAGGMAEIVYGQIDNIDERLIAVIDTLMPEERKHTHFKGHIITAPEELVLEEKNETAIVVCTDFYNDKMDILIDILKNVGGVEEQIFIDNPYTSCRRFAVNEEFSKDIRIPTNRDIYNKLEELFRDKESIEIYKILRESKTLDLTDMDYEFIPYSRLKSLLYSTEDYWLTYNFENKTMNEVTVFDCGAYIGDSINPICSNLPCSNIYYRAFEPVDENINQINSMDYNTFCKELTIYPFGVSDKTEDKVFMVNDDYLDFNWISEVAEKSEKNIRTETLKVVSIDELKPTIHGQLFIKMDIEGAELAALHGCEKTMIRHRPFLAICVYHRKNDIIDIPDYLNSILKDYHFYLRGGYHTILWAIPAELDEV